MSAIFDLEILPGEAGFGFRLRLEPRTPYLVLSRVGADSPASRAGLRVGDKVLAVEETTAVRKSVDQVAHVINKARPSGRLSVVCLRVPRRQDVSFKPFPIRFDTRELQVMTACLDELNFFIMIKLNQYLLHLQQFSTLNRQLEQMQAQISAAPSRRRKNAKPRLSTVEKEYLKVEQDREAVKTELDKLVPTRPQIVEAFRKLRLLFILLTRSRPALGKLNQHGHFDFQMAQAFNLFVKLNRNTNFMFKPAFSLIGEADSPLFSRQVLAQFEEMLRLGGEEGATISRHLGSAWKTAVEDWNGEIKHYKPTIPPSFAEPIYLRCLDPDVLLQWRKSKAEKETTQLAARSSSVTLTTEERKRMSADLNLMSDSQIDESKRRQRDYCDLAPLGKGGFGTAVLCERRRDGSKVVVKEVRLGADADKSRREAAIMAECAHGFIVRFFDHFEEDGLLYIEMEFCSRGTLEDEVDRFRSNAETFPENKYRRWTMQLAMAVQYLHHNKVIHRDIKPKNIFLDDGERVKLGDLGAAKILSDDGGKYGRDGEYQHTVIFTFGFVSPELLNGDEYGFKADIWSLGVVFYYMASLQLPFGQRIADVPRIMSGTRPPLPEPFNSKSALNRLLSRMLELDQQDRTDIDQVVLDLTDTLSS